MRFRIKVVGRRPISTCYLVFNGDIYHGFEYSRVHLCILGNFIMKSLSKTKIYDNEHGWTKVIYDGICVIKFNDLYIQLDGGTSRFEVVRRRINAFARLYKLGIYVANRGGQWHAEIDIGPHPYIEKFRNLMVIQRSAE